MNKSVNKDGAPLPNRLTWNPTDPLPFESCWSIFRKIMLLNYLSFSELMQMVSNNGAVREMRRNHYLGDSKWVNFDRMASLLGVEESRLRNGFLDQIGFRPHRLLGSAYVIRHCKKCESLSYHCILFDLAMVARCPWHGVRLEEERTENRRRVLNNQYISVVDPSKNIVMNYGGIQDKPKNNAVLENLYDERILISGYCTYFTEWWKDAMHSASDARTLLERACLVGIVAGGDRNRLENIVSFAHSLSTEPYGWGLVKSPFNVGISSRHSAGKFDATYARSYRIQSNLGCQFRSIIRRLKRHYLKPHRRCISILMSMDTSERLALKASAVCPVAMAYVVWRMTLDGDRFARHTNDKNLPNAFRLYGDSVHQLDLDSRVLTSYLNFFEIYRKLKNSFDKATVDVISSNSLSEHIEIFSNLVNVVDKDSKFSKSVIFTQWIIPDISTALFPRTCASPHKKEDWIDQMGLQKLGEWAWGSPYRLDKQFYRVLPSDLAVNWTHHKIAVSHFDECNEI